MYAIFHQLGPFEILMILGVGVVFFGRRLPEVGRYLGKGIVEFKKGLRGIEDDVDVNAAAVTTPSAAPEAPRPPARITATAPKFQDVAVDSEGQARYQGEVKS